MIIDFGDHYYHDTRRGYFYDPFDYSKSDCNYKSEYYYTSLEKCKDAIAAEESYQIQYNEMRWEYMCSW